MSSIAVVAGEASGDIHAGNLVAALRRRRPDLRVWAVGGEALARAGAEIVFPSAAIAGMGLVESAGNLPALLRARRQVLERFAAEPPDLFVPVDFGGFNLRLCAAAHRNRIPTVYYIPPKVWAWGRWRVRKLRAWVARALVILPFEEAFYREHGIAAHYVGSPVLDHLAPRSHPAEDRVVGLLPGSRPGEVTRILPLLVQVARRLAAERPLRFLVPRAPGLPEALLGEPLQAAGLPVEILDGDAQQVMERARVCVMASGTATLECALVGTPLVSVYQVSPLTYALGRLLVRVPFFSLPNLIAGRQVVPEFLQPAPGEVARAVAELIDEGPARSAQLEALAAVRAAVGEPGASERAAGHILDLLGTRGGSGA
ncbi:MAG: lipid-A-disaccharide synthase [Deferrisomatales bacterium]|nr:lipid-A-disaccharide synthase [Deferrisomatales bacterium]